MNEDVPLHVLEARASIPELSVLVLGMKWRRNGEKCSPRFEMQIARNRILIAYCGASGGGSVIAVMPDIFGTPVTARSKRKKHGNRVKVADLSELLLQKVSSKASTLPEKKLETLSS